MAEQGKLFGPKGSTQKILSAEEQRRAERRLKDLETKRDTLESELRDLGSFHSAAWAEYGSELCAGGMLRDEQELRNRIRSYNDDIALLRGYLQGDQPEADPEAVAAIEVLEEERKRIDSEKAPLSQRVLKAERVAQLLEGKF